VFLVFSTIVGFVSMICGTASLCMNNSVVLLGALNSRNLINVLAKFAKNYMLIFLCSANLGNNVTFIVDMLSKILIGSGILMIVVGIVATVEVFLVAFLLVSGAFFKAFCFCFILSLLYIDLFF
jgi:hypothetical protein